MIRWFGFAVATVTGMLFFACGEETAETLCEPGTEVFCKCRGGFEGTKTCQADGATFGECTTPEGGCPEIEETTSTSGTTAVCLAGESVACECTNGDPGMKVCADDGSAFGDCTTESGSCGSGSGDKLLYSACADGGECATGTCENGYCTRTCAVYTDCYDEPNMLYGDCVELAGSQICAVYCLSQGECSAYGAESACGGTTDLNDPNIAFAVCAFWGDALQGMPYGTVCDPDAGQIGIFNDQFVDGECSLGAPGVQNYCYDTECTKLCYEDVDCPLADCTSNGSVAGCCMSEPECN